jgi:hypothetical protein
MSRAPVEERFLSKYHFRMARGLEIQSTGLSRSY